MLSIVSVQTALHLLIFDWFVPAQGGATIVKLQSLLSSGFFGNAYTLDMLLSVTTGKYPAHSRLSELYSIYDNQ